MEHIKMLADEFQNEDEGHYLVADGGDCDCKGNMPDPIGVAGVRG